MSADRKRGTLIPDAPKRQDLLSDFLFISHVGLIKFQLDGTVEVANPLAARLLAPDTDLSNAYIALAPLMPDLAARLSAFQVETGVVIDHVRCPVANGTGQAVLSLTVHRIQGGWHMATVEDVTAQVDQERQAQQDQQRFRAIFDNIRDYEVYTVDLDGIIDGQPLGGALKAPTQRRASGIAPAVLAEARRTGSVETEGWTARADGSLVRTNTVVTALPDANGGVRGFVVVCRDVTERKRMEARITHMAHHDALTGLPNRVLFHDRLREAIARSHRGEQYAVLLLDLDRFRALNDTMGHAVGDELLRAVAQRLKRHVREIDTVARLGSDEFAIVQAHLDQPQSAIALATRLLDLMAAPYELDGQPVTIGASVGIAVIPGDGATADQILKNADLALRRAKTEGRNRYRFFEAEMDARMQARRTLELDLRKALGANEFELYYQPLMDIKTRSVIGFEALLRWHHPERGMVPPMDFIPLAEEIGLIIPLGEWVLKQACADAVTWPENHKVAVNLSPIQFSSKTLVADVAGALAASGLPPKRLELEITETVMMEDTDAVLTTLHQLRDLGVEIAMDDFGTGYSSLSYLRRFPFDKVKIDRSFVQGLGQGGDCDAIVTMVIELCKALGMTSTAEGVETEAQLQRLSGSNCTEAQGYLFSRPRPANEVPSLCRTLACAATH